MENDSAANVAVPAAKHLLRMSWSTCRPSLYDQIKGESAENLTLMRRIDELFLKHLFSNARPLPCRPLAGRSAPVRRRPRYGLASRLASGQGSTSGQPQADEVVAVDRRVPLA